MSWLDLQFMLIKDKKLIRMLLQWSSKNDERLESGRVGRNGKKVIGRKMCRE